MDIGNLHERNGAKSTWEVIYSEELGRDDRLVYKVSFWCVRRTWWRLSDLTSLAWQTTDRSFSPAILEEFSIASKIWTLCHRISKEKTFFKVVSLLPLVEWRNLWLHICTLTPDHKTITQHLQPVPRRSFWKTFSPQLLITSRPLSLGNFYLLGGTKKGTLLGIADFSLTVFS